VEGCDYSVVEASAAPSVAPAPRQASRRVSQAAFWRRNNRFHIPGAAIRQTK
jgi:hypothetical protein